MKTASVFPPSLYDAQLASQGGTCASCSATSGANGGKLRTRGTPLLFCGACNRFWKKFRKEIEAFRKPATPEVP